MQVKALLEKLPAGDARLINVSLGEILCSEFARL